MPAWATADTFAIGDKPTAVQVNEITGDLNIIGGAWTAFTATWTATGAAPVLGNGALTGAYKQVDKTVHFWIKLLMGASTTYGSGTYKLALPVAAACPVNSPLADAVAVDASASAKHLGVALVNTSTTLYVVHDVAPSVNLTSVAPFTWANGDSLLVAGTYEAA